MKNLLSITAVVALVTIAACKQNNCEGVVCNNGGVCVDGNCQCTSAFTGTNCDVHTNPCDTVACYNGGLCNAGVCNCPAHTSGPFCQTQETPSEIWCPRLVIEGFNPADPSGNLWDTGGMPDIYPVVKLGSTVIFDRTSWKRDNANYNTWYSFDLGTSNFQLPDFTNPNYRMEVWDYDGGSGLDTYMDGFNFTPYTDSTGFRGSIELTDTVTYHDKFIMRVYFNYYW